MWRSDSVFSTNQAGTIEKSKPSSKTVSKEGSHQGIIRGSPADLRTTLQRTEKGILEELAKKYKNKTELSRILDMDRSSLWRKLKKYGIQD